MKSVHRIALAYFCCACVWILGVSANDAQALDIQVALEPSATTVPAGSEFEVHIDVTAFGPEFNCYEAFVKYDPAMLTFLPASPVSLQEGAYMTEACGNTFHVFQPEANTLHITHSLLCADTYLTGPGALYVLRFRANATSGPTTVEFDQIAFYRGGYTTSLGTVTDAIIQIAGPTDVGGPRAPRFQLEVAPNPFNPTTVISIEAPAAGYQRLVVHDTRGRVVDVLQSGEFAAGPRNVLWSGVDAGGQRLASGAYLVTLETSHGSRTRRVVLVK